MKDKNKGSARAIFLAVLLTVAASGAVVDRIAVIVGTKVITESQVLQELRLTEFLNQAPLDLGPAKKREEAERMVDQQLIRNEITTSQFPMPAAESADTMLADFRRDHFVSNAAFRAALTRYGVTEAEVKERLLWQLAVIQFTDQRFRPELALTTPPANTQSADRVKPGTETPAGPSVDQLLEQWLKQARSNTRVIFKPEAFE